MSSKTGQRRDDNKICKTRVNCILTYIVTGRTLGNVLFVKRYSNLHIVFMLGISSILYSDTLTRY